MTYQAEAVTINLHDVARMRTALGLHPRLDWRDGQGKHTTTIERLTLVGSSPSAELVIDDPAVSRLHAELDPRPDGLWIRDLGSRNGTEVAGVRVTLARVPSGGTVRLGSTTITVNRQAQRLDLWPDDHFGPLLGRSLAMRELFSRLSRVAALDASVLINGETGTGKELVARAIHEASPRAAGPLVVVDCGALTEELLPSELFGHARGAFTGALQSRVGAIEAAAGGTVFLDEIGELPLAMQPMLLRVLESRTVRRVGETTHRKIDVRFVSATHRDLRSMVNAGGFREDLYFRLAVVPVTVPPLRDRMEDAAQLVDHFLPAAHAVQKADLLRAVRARPWLGNVRELRNYLERAVVLGPDSEDENADRTTPDAPFPVALPTPGVVSAGPPFDQALYEKSMREFRDTLEGEYLRRLIARHGGKISAAAQAAGLNRAYLYRLIRKYRQ